MLLKQRVLHALTRLGDRDTIRVAVKELTRLIATMPPEHIPVVIGCLCDEAAAAPKAVARRVRPRPRPSRPSNARRFPINASVFQRPTYRLTWRTSFPARTISHAAGGPSSAGYHRRDARRVFPPAPPPRGVRARASVQGSRSVVTDACVDGRSLAERVALFRPGIHRVVLSGPEAIGPHFVRPILDVIHETNSRAAQDTASRPLRARVPSMRRDDVSCPRGCQLVPGRRTGTTRAQTRPYARREDVLRQTGAVGGHHRAVSIRGGCRGAATSRPCSAFEFRVRASMSTTKTTKTRLAAAAEAEENTGGLLGALKSPDWPTRRGAAESVAALLYALGPALDNDTVATTPLVDAIEARVRECGFDKVRPARDAVHVAMSLVQALRRYGEERLPRTTPRRVAFRAGRGGRTRRLLGRGEPAPPPARRARASLR